MTAKPAGSSSAVPRAEPRITREEVWRRLGAPTDQVGSVNEPRTHDEYGVRWNEKWVYRGENDESVERVALWNRYDFLGAFAIAPDGTARREALPE